MGTGTIAVIVGDGVDSALALPVAMSADHVLCYTLNAALVLQDSLGFRPQVIDSTADYAQVQVLAEEWTDDFLSYLSEHLHWADADVLKTARRMLLLRLFVPIALARLRAAAVQRTLPSGSVVHVFGVADEDVVELRVRGLHSAPVSRGANPTASDATPVHQRTRTAKAFALLVLTARVLVRDARESWRLRHLRPDMRRARKEREGSSVLVLAGAQVHLKLLHTALVDLRRRGWTVRVVDLNSVGPSLADPLQPELVPESIAPYFRTAEPLRVLVRRRLRSSGIHRVVAAWVARAGLQGYEGRVAVALAGHYDEIERFRQAHLALLRATRPRAVVTVNEISPLVESAVPASRALGIPVINVQHGSALRMPLNSRFDFDAFCVWGEADGETFVDLGAPPGSMRVVGNPFMDLDVPRQAGLNPHEARNSSSATVLFAAGYSTNLISDMSLYSTLKMVLEHAERDSRCSIVMKLHPIGENKELGYEAALAEHPGVRVHVTRSENLYELIRGSDCIATHASTVGIEAASYRKPTIVLSPGGAPDILPLVSEGIALRATSSEEFGECVRRIQSGGAIPEDAFVRFENRYSAGRDGRAGTRIADACEDLAGRPR